jgi:hypothetical protein
MFQRNSQPSSSSHAPHDDAFVADVQDLHAENLLSAQRASKLLRKAAKAGVQVPKSARLGGSKNMARAQRRMQLRRTKWPEYYWFDCRVVDRKTRKEHIVRLCLLLPQEVLSCIYKLGSPDVVLETDGMDSDSLEHLNWIRAQLGLGPDDKIQGFGLHGDGIPCNYDRTESVVMISINLPGCTGANGRMRIPLFAMPDWAIGPNTLDDVMTVVAWSMRHALAATKPCARHDGSHWNEKEDASRAKDDAYAMPIPATMVQSRADWDWMGKCFHMPFHNVKLGCCWLCGCRREEVLHKISNAYAMPCAPWTE